MLQKAINKTPFRQNFIFVTLKLQQVFKHFARGIVLPINITNIYTMKKIAKVFVLAAAITLGVTAASQAQIVVRIHPARPHVVYRRPPAPSPRHVWVDEDWVARGRGYAWHGGYWAVPPREHAVYVPGRWERRRGGEVWIAGHWR
jgi:hypothetical protein